MLKGYFAGLLVFGYRETMDGRRVTARRLVPFVPPRWLVVPAEMQARFERRFKQGHVGAMLTLPVGMRLAGTDAPFSSLLLAALVASFVSVPLAQWWSTAGLPAYVGDAATLVPLRRQELDDRQARAMGTPTVMGFVVLSVLLTIPQAIVAIQDGVWWAWLGFAMFASLALYFARMLYRLRKEEREARAT